MTEPSTPFPPTHPATLLLAVLALSCIGDTMSPSNARRAGFQLVPQFESAAPSGIVPIDRVQILLARLGELRPALDTVVRISVNDTVVDLSLTVVVFGSVDTFNTSLALITPAGEIAFRGGPVQVTARSGVVGRPSPISVPIRYTGIGAGADSVVITLQPASVITGDTVRFQAVAYDNNLPVPGTPVGWRSLDTGRAWVPQAAVGNVVGRGGRGAARIVAQLLTGPADTGLVSVQPLPAAIAIVSGNNQTSVVRTVLGQPIVAEVQASDSIGVAGVWVRFAVQAGGGSLSTDSALTSADGRASAQWALGPVAGVQQVRATTARLPAAQVTFTATALAAAAASIAVHDGDNQNGIVGAALATAPSVLVTDPDRNPVPNVGVTFAMESGGGMVTGATQKTGTDGIARAGGWTLGTVPGRNTLTATMGAGTAGARSVTFAATGVPGAAASFAVAAFPETWKVGVPWDFTVTATDRYGNVATGYTGTVRFTSSDPLALLPSNYTFVSADRGKHTFAGAVTLRTPGGQTVTVTDVANPSLTGSTTVTVLPAAAQ